MKIECNEKQIRLIAEALEYYSRHLSGQLEITLFPELVWCRMVKEGKDYNVAQGIINLAKIYGWNLSANENIGVGKSKKLTEGENETKDLAYEMYKCIRHFLWEQDPERGSYSTDSYNGLHFTKEEKIRVSK